MREEREKLRAITEVIDRFDEALRNSPGMLGAPEEIYANFFYLDKIRFILQEKEDFDDFDKSWIGFLIHKKLIVGAANYLLEDLRAGDFDYEALLRLRSEYLSWRNGAGS